jgi:hypothetical protein
MAYDVQAIRKKLQSSARGKFNDPDMFKPEKAQDTTTPIKYRFFVLPPLMKGDTTNSGNAGQSMEQFFVTHGNHWVNDRPHPCPRIYSEGADECPICSFGFDLLREEQNQEKRRLILQQWMPQSYYMVNIYFPNVKTNPEDLRGKTKYYNASKTLFDQWTSCLLRDDAGDPEDPQAFGVFFDESSAFCYQLEVLKSGRNNSYKTSKFLANGGDPVAIAKTKEGETSSKAIQKILDIRIDLYSKIEEPDLDKIKKLANIMINGEDDDGFDEDETLSGSTTTESTTTESATTTVESDSLEDEVPFEAEADSKPADPKPADPKPADAGSDDTGDADSSANKEIEDLLGQLDEDDD